MKKDTQDMQSALDIVNKIINDPCTTTGEDDASWGTFLSYRQAKIIQSALQQKPAVLEGERKDALEALKRCPWGHRSYLSDETLFLVNETIKSALQSSAVEAVSFDEAFDSVHAYFRQQNSVLSFHKAQTDMVIRALVAANLLKLKDLKIITDITEE